MIEYASKDKAATYVYRKNGITYVPHYRNASVYVGPGYPRYNNRRYSEQELIDAGAKRQEQMLWPRSQYGIVSDAKP